MFKYSRDERMKKRRKSEEKHVGTSGGTRMKERVVRGDIRGILLEIQCDVIIFRFISNWRDKVKKFPLAKQERYRFLRSFGNSTFLNEARFTGIKEEIRTSKNGNAVINIIIKCD